MKMKNILKTKTSRRVAFISSENEDIAKKEAEI